jgi:site-specific recombinase XerD
MTPFPPAHPNQLGEFFETRLQVLATTHRYYRIAAHRFLTYLQTHFPGRCGLSDLRRDPHLLGWLHSLDAEDPPLSNSTRRLYLIGLRRLLHDPVSEDHAMHPALIRREDFPLRPPRPRKPRPTQNRRSPLPHSIFADIFETHIQTLTATLQPITIAGYRVVARDFLLYLQNHFPQLRQLSDLRRDPHWLDWLRSLAEHQPSFSEITRQKYRLKLRALFQQLASRGLLLQDELLLIEDSPSPLRRTHHQFPHPTLGKIFETQIQTLATTLRPNTIHGYQHTTRRFLSFLQTHFPQLQQISDLRRDPHWLAWLRSLHEQNPPLSNATRQGYLLDLRRLLNDLASQGHSLPPELIVPEDFPPRPRYLPRALSPEDDHRLQQELRRQDDLLSQALLLTRATGIRIGECIDLAVDCLRLLAQDQWALHVPLGKLHTERLVPVDDDVRQMVSRILTLRAQSIYSKLANAASFLLPRPYGPARVYQSLRYALSQAAQQAGCSHHVSCHQLRHTYATEMVRMGVNLPALMQLLGHKDIRMTLRYVQVTQQDLQREYYTARRNAAASQLTPTLLLPSPRSSTTSSVKGILQAIAATTHLVEMYRRQSGDEQTSKKVQRLAKRLGSVASEFRRFATAEK